MTSIASLCMGCMKAMENHLSCPECGKPLRAQKNTVALPLKTILNNRFLVGRVLGKPGGFGITYLAWDMLLETTAAIKEFIPLSSVSRDPKNTSIRAHSQQDHLLFKQGLQIFLEEAKTLAKFTHPNIVRIRDCFTSNNTAYLVMEYHQGLPLDQVVLQAGGHLSEDRALEIIIPVLDGLEAVHKKGFLHRDIKPQNLYLTDKGVPLLLDFGASRFALTDNTKSLTVMLSAGYAPFEQYHKKGKQGVWSDIYSIGATLYFMTTGKMPVDAIERQQEDNITPPSKHNPQLSLSFSQAILKAMSINPDSRPENIAELKQTLLAGSHQFSPYLQNSVVSKPLPLATKTPIKKPSRQSIIIQHNKQKNTLNLGRILIYMGIVAILWSGWSTRQMLKNNKLPVAQIIVPNSTETEAYIIQEDIFYDTFEESEVIFDFNPEMEIDYPLDEDIQRVEPQIHNKKRQNIDPSPTKVSHQPIHRPMHPAFPEMAFSACKNKKPRSQCQFNFPNGEQQGVCLPEIQGRLACAPRIAPAFPPPHLLNKR